MPKPNPFAKKGEPDADDMKLAMKGKAKKAPPKAKAKGKKY